MKLNHLISRSAGLVALAACAVALTSTAASAQSVKTMHRAKAAAQAAPTAQAPAAKAPAPAKPVPAAPAKSAAPTPAPATKASLSPARTTVSAPARTSTTKTPAAGARTRSESAAVAAPAPAPAPKSEAVVMTPATPATEVAAVLATKAPGERVVHLSGFAGDVTSYDTVKAKPAEPAAAPVASIETKSAPAEAPVTAPAPATEPLPVGTATVHARVKESMIELRDTGAKVDAFTVESPSTLPAGPAGEAVLAKAVDSAVKEVFPDAKAPERTNSSGGEGGIASEGQGSGSSGSATAPASAPQDPMVTEINTLTKRTRDDAHAALSAIGQRRLPGWHGTLQYRGVDWDRIFTLAMDNPAMRGTLFGFVQSAGSIAGSDPSRYRRPATLAEIPADMMDPLAASAGPNREVRALAMSDCTQADFLRNKGLTLAIAARYGNNPDHLAKIIEILTAVADWGQFQRPGWSLADPTRTMPEGGDGVNMATAWGINGVVDILHVLGDRVPADLRKRLMLSLRREIAAIVDSWAYQRPWYVKSGSANSNQWIDPSAALMKACMFVGDPELMPAYILGAENLARSLSLSGQDGAFLEGVSYAQMSLGPVFDTLIAARMTGDARFGELTFTDRSWNWFMHMIMPGGMLVNCSDSRMSSLPSGPCARRSRAWNWRPSRRAILRPCRRFGPSSPSRASRSAAFASLLRWRTRAALELRSSQSSLGRASRRSSS